MTARGHLRGHPIEWDEENQRWCYSDTGVATEDEWRDRPCGHCGRHDTPEGHDACLGTLPGVINACCGHGDHAEAYIMFDNGITVRGFKIDRQ